MRKLFLLLIAAPLSAQMPAIRLINAPDASSPHVFGNVVGVRQLPAGGVLVNDIQKRQLTLLDPSLASPTLVADSASGTANSYGVRPGGLIAYFGDSTLFVDPAGLSMFVIDPAGKIARVASVPRSQDAMYIGTNVLGTPGIDSHGRLVYRGGFTRMMPQPVSGGKMPSFPEPPDSAALVRVELATRKLDTAAFFKIPKLKMNVQQTDNGIRVTSEQNPMPVVDDWAVLADGSIAIVRGQDFHVDVVHPDGTMSSGGKIPFDWQRLTDDEKVAVIDSAKAAFERARSRAGAADGAVQAGRGAGGGRGDGMVVMSFRGGEGGGIRTDAGGGGLPPVTFISPSELPDYRPAFSGGAAKADLDGNLWVRTSATRDGSVGGPIYDVVNAKGELVDRVQIPAGRQIVGFGKGGVVYMVASDASGAWLERTHR